MDKNDTVIDMKFLLAQAIGSQPQFIHIVKNFTERIFSNSSSLLQQGLLTDNNDNLTINYWLEFPQTDTNKPNEFVIRSQPQLLQVPDYMTNIGKCFRYFTKKFRTNAHLGYHSLYFRLNNHIFVYVSILTNTKNNCNFTIKKERENGQ